MRKGFTVLQITPRLESGGVEEVTIAVAGAIAKAGGTSLVASRGGRLEASLAAVGAGLVRLPVDSRNPISMARNTAALRRTIRDEGVDVVHVRSRAPAFSAWAAARAEDTAMVATYHGVYAARSPLKRWYNAIMTRGDLVLVGSRFIAEHVAAEHHVPPERVAMVPEGVDADLWDPRHVSPERVSAARISWGVEAADAGPVLLLAARLTRLKGHALAIEALARLDREDVVLVCAGRGGRSEFCAELRRLARRMGVAERVRFPGACKDMAAAYLACDLVLAPSTIPESFGRTVVEAGAMERPVLASAFGGPAEIIEDERTGWLVAPGDPLAWSAKIAGALDVGVAARARMGKAARARIASVYSAARMFEATFAAYARVARGRS